MRVNGEPLRKLSELGETNVAETDFASDQRQLQIDFFALGFGTGETLRTVNLNLSPGSYRFLVRAVNADGAASENPASLSFSIARPVWQRWWNGAGFNVDEKTVDNQDNFGGSGLPNMRRRAANLGGRFEIESQIGAGTSVFVSGLFRSAADGFERSRPRQKAAASA